MENNNRTKNKDRDGRSSDRLEKDRLDDELDEDGKIRLIPEIVKKLLATGVSAAFLTEESIRAYLQDAKLPKDVLGKLIDGAARSKQELMDRVGNEVVAIIKKIDFVKEASRFVEEHKFKISAEIEVVRKAPTARDD